MNPSMDIDVALVFVFCSQRVFFMPENFLNQITVEHLAAIAVKAGEAIMQIYDQPEAWQVDMKSDASPLTQADVLANQIIVEALTKLAPEIPILTEESPWAGGSSATYWAVDPLDGTKEFIKRNGEFTVNIALVIKGVPCMGVICAPALKMLWAGVAMSWAKRAKFESFDQFSANELEWSSMTVATSGPLMTSSPFDRKLRMLGSRSHGGDDLPVWLRQALGETTLIEKGSSLKFCLIAQGDADVYVRMGPTSIWDTAAGHAILAGAGGKVINAQDRSELTYNDPRQVLNPNFVAYAPSRILLV